MNHNPISVRLFRITGARLVNPTLVIEYVELGEFKDLGGCGIDATFLAEVSEIASVDKYIFSALDALRRQGLSGSGAELPPKVSRSIDEAVDQMAEFSETLRRERIEFQERWSRERSIDKSGERKQPGVPTEPDSALKFGVGTFYFPDAVAVQMKGFRSVIWFAMFASMAWISSSVLRRTVELLLR